MPRLSLLFFLASALLVAGCAGAAPTLRAGEWQVTSGAAGQPAVAYRLCMKSGGAEDLGLLLPHLQGSTACPAPVVREQDGALIWELACPAARLSVHGRYTVEAERVAGEVEVISGNPPQTRHDHLKAGYAGACAAP